LRAHHAQVTVLVMSLCFIGFVTFLHAGAKLMSFRK
jgi:cbb3-type cytochrome oxidase subunit 3